MIGVLISANCQNRKDSSVIGNKDLRKAAILIEQGKACITEVRLYQNENNLLYQRINLKDSTIKRNDLERTYKDLQISNYKLEVSNLEEQGKIKSDGIKVLEKEVKRQKRKTVFVGVAGTLASLGLFYLLVTK